MLRRLFALLILAALAVAGLYYWKYRTTGEKPPKLGEVGQQLTDARLTGEVKAALGLNRNLKPYSIDVATEDAVVSLRGAVPSNDLRATAERIAAAVPDVKQVVNHVRVEPTATPAAGRDRTLGESLDDHALELQVRLAFSLHRELKGSSIEVQAFRKEVTLKGEVANPEQRRVAVDLAKDVAGVEGVKDEMRLKGEVAAAGRQAAVEQALKSNANLKRYDIKVLEKSGRLILSGRVRTGAEKDLAGLVARDAAGGPVENALDVGP